MVSQGHSLVASHHCRDYFRLRGSARVNAQRVIDTPARSMDGFIAKARCSMWIGKGDDPYNRPPTDRDRDRALVLPGSRDARPAGPLIRG
jgi:hypothetical protein